VIRDWWPQTTAGGNINDTWAFRFDTGQWTQLETQTAPSPRSGMMGAYVESEGRFIIFGGSGDQLLNDVWELSRVTTPAATNLAAPAKTAIAIVNPGGEFAGASLPAADLSAPARDSAMLPLVTEGGGWSTQIVLINSTDQVLSGSIQFPSQNQASIITGSGLPYVIPARSARIVQRVGAAYSLQTYWARVTPMAGQGGARCLCDRFISSRKRLRNPHSVCVGNTRHGIPDLR